MAPLRRVVIEEEERERASTKRERRSQFAMVVYAAAFAPIDSVLSVA